MRHFFCLSLMLPVRPPRGPLERSRSGWLPWCCSTAGPREGSSALGRNKLTHPHRYTPPESHRTDRGLLMLGNGEGSVTDDRLICSFPFFEFWVGSYKYVFRALLSGSFNSRNTCSWPYFRKNLMLNMPFLQIFKCVKSGRMTLYMKLNQQQAVNMPASTDVL